MRLTIIAIACFAALCCGFGCVNHPFTKVGAIGYYNQGYEKGISMDVVGAEGGLPLQVDLNGDGTPETVRLYRFSVANDATKAYEAESRNLDRLYGLIGQQMTMLQELAFARFGTPPVPTQPGQKWWQALLADPEAVAALKAALTGGGG